METTLKPILEANVALLSQWPRNRMSFDTYKIDYKTCIEILGIVIFFTLWRASFAGKLYNNKPRHTPTALTLTDGLLSLN